MNSLILSTEPSQYFAELIARSLNLPELPLERKLFQDGEHYYRLALAQKHDLLHKDIVFVGSTHTDDAFLELVRVGSALASQGTKRRIFIIPYFGYAAMERATLIGETVTAKENVRMLSSMPNSGMGNIFLMLDLHSSELIYYFEGTSLPFELTAESVLIDAIKRLNETDVVFASTDLGRPGRIESLAKVFNTKIAFISKTRNFETVTVQAVIGDVKDKTVIIYDDMIRSAGSLIKASDAYLAHGAKAVYAAVTHLALTNQNVVDLIEQSSLKKVIATNSHPMSQLPKVARSHKIEIVDVSPVFSEAIEEILTK